MGRQKKIDTIFKDKSVPKPTEQTADTTLTPEEEAELERQEEAAAQANEWLSEFQARFTDQPVKIQVEKFDDAGDWALCRKYPLQNFDPDRVRIEYGGGRYRCTLYDPQGKWIKGGRTYFKFAEPLTIEPPDTQTVNPLENPMVVMLMNAQKESTNMLMGIMQSLLAAQGANPTKGANMTDLVETVKAINGMAPKEKPLDTFKEQLNLFKLVKEVTGDSDGDSKGGLISDLKEVIEVLPLLKEHMATLKPPATAPAPIIAPGKPETMDPLSKKIIELVPKFVGGARANAPVGEWGNYLLDVFDAEVMPLLLPVMKEKYRALVANEDDVFDIVIRLAKDPAERAAGLKQIPPLAPYMPWVNQVIDEAIRLAELGDDQPLPTGGNAILETVAENGKAETPHTP